MTITLVILTLILTTKVLRCDADLIIAAKKAAAIGGDLEHLYNHNHDLRRIWEKTKIMYIDFYQDIDHISSHMFKDNLHRNNVDLGEKDFA